MSAPILTTKLFIPPIRPQSVARPRLFERLHQSLHAKLILISAPAGFGKSILLSQWLHEQSLPVAWLSLDENDNTTTGFLTYMITALQTVDANIGQDVLAQLQAQANASHHALTSLINALAQLPQEMILVLDDYHAVDSPEIDEVIAFLLEYLPPQLHLVIATREDPQIPLARLRARQELAEIRVADLRFTAEESANFLNKMMNLSLSEADILALEKRTEGWIAGLQLAALSLRGRDDTAEFIEAFTGSHRFILDYLIEEVLQHQPDELRQFLLHIAILDRFNAELCDTVLESQDSQDKLRHLERGNIFLIALDEHHNWYRFHHLFADALRTYLRQEDKETLSGLHLRASRWFADQNFTPEAIHHALQAEAYDYAADLIELIFPVMDEVYQLRTWIRWHNALPKTIVDKRPILNIGHAWSLLGRGFPDEAEEQLRRAEAWFAQSDDATSEMVVLDLNFFESLPATISSARAYGALTMGDPENGLKYAEEAFNRAPSREHSGYRQGLALTSISHWMQGNVEEALSYLTQFRSNSQVIDYEDEALSTIFLIAELELIRGNLQTAVRRYEEWMPRIVERDILGAPDVYTGLARLYCEKHELDKTTQHLKTAMKDDYLSLPNWESRQAMAYAMLDEARGDIDSALAYLDEAESQLTPAPLPIIPSIMAQRARLWLMQGDLERVQEWARDQQFAINDDIAFAQTYDYLIFARFLSIQAQTKHTLIDDALQLLQRLQDDAQTRAHNGILLDIHITLAYVHQLHSNTTKALEYLTSALTLGEREVFVYRFVREGDWMYTLLQIVNRQQVTPRYTQRILNAFATPQAETESSAQTELIDALSEREIEVLHWLRTDMSGPEISDKLMVSLNTFRTHTKNIYSKLAVGNRRAAVRRAEELSLL